MEFPRLNNTLVLGLGQKARHGKDTAAAWLVKMSGATRFAFSDALYAYARVEHGMTTKDAPLLQKIGVQMRERDPLTWVKALYYDILTKEPKIAVITDVRFPNEAAFIKSVGGYTCKVSRFNEDGTPFVTTDRDPNHTSETALDGHAWDFAIQARTGDITTLHEKIMDVYFDADHLRRKAMRACQ